MDEMQCGRRTMYSTDSDSASYVAAAALRSMYGMVNQERLQPLHQPIPIPHPREKGMVSAHSVRAVYRLISPRVASLQHHLPKARI